MTRYLEEIAVADFAVLLRLGLTGFRWLFLVYICNNAVSTTHFGDRMANSYWLRST